MLDDAGTLVGMDDTGEVRGSEPVEVVHKPQYFLQYTNAVEVTLHIPNVESSILQSTPDLSAHPSVV